MLNHEKPRELWTEGASRQWARDMVSRRIVDFAGHLWARTRVVVNGQQLRSLQGTPNSTFQPPALPPKAEGYQVIDPIPISRGQWDLHNLSLSSGGQWL